jgi:hypothetical protein
MRVNKKMVSTEDESEQEDGEHISHSMIIVNKSHLFSLTQTGLC